MADDPAVPGPVWCRLIRTIIPGREPDELFTTHAAQGVRGIGGFGRRRRALCRARASGRIHLQIRQQPAGVASDERPRQGDGGGDQDRDQRPLRHADFPEQPARLRHRHAEPGALRRHRVLHAVGPDPGDAGAGGLDQRHRLRVPGLRHGLEGDGRRSRRLCARRNRQGQSRGHGQDLGQRLSPDHVVDQADQRPRRLQGLQDPRAGVAAVDLDVQGVRRLAGLDQFQRGLFGAADQDRRRPGKSAGADLDRQAVRSAEILLADQPHVGRLLVPGQPPRLGGAAGRPPRHRRQEHQRGRGQGARRHRQAERAACAANSKARAWCSTSPMSAPFRDKLRSAGFYAEWKGKYGDQAWALLEKSVGKLS